MGLGVTEMQKYKWHIASTFFKVLNPDLKEIDRYTNTGKTHTHTHSHIHIHTDRFWRQSEWDLPDTTEYTPREQCGSVTLGLAFLCWKSLNPDGCPLFSEPTSSPVKDTRWPPYPAGSVLEVLSGSRWLTSYRGAKKKDQASMFQLLQAEPTQSNEKTRGWDSHALLDWPLQWSGAG